MAGSQSRLFTLGLLNDTRFRKTVTSSNMPAMVFPRTFVKNKWREGFPTKIILTTGDGIAWPALVARREADVMLTNGWGLFREFYDFEENDTLVFAYDGVHHFMVTIFDEKTECERLLVKIVEPYAYDVEIHSGNPPNSDSPDWEDNEAEGLPQSGGVKVTENRGHLGEASAPNVFELSSDSEDEDVECSQNRAMERRIAQATDLLKWSRDQSKSILDGKESDLSALFEAAADEKRGTGIYGQARGASRGGNSHRGDAGFEGANRRVNLDFRGRTGYRRRSEGITIGRGDAGDVGVGCPLTPGDRGKGKVSTNEGGSGRQLPIQNSGSLGESNRDWVCVYFDSRGGGSSQARGRYGNVRGPVGSSGNKRMRELERGPSNVPSADDGDVCRVVVTAAAVGRNGTLPLPSWWAMNQLTFGTNARMLRIDQSGSYWNVICNLSGTSAFVTVGWYDFVLFNKLKANDEVEIEANLIDSRNWFVKIRRGV